MTTAPFRIQPSEYLRNECGNLLSRSLPFILVFVFVAAIASCIDIRFALVGLMFLFLILPFVVFHIYFHKLLDSRAVRALALKQVSIGSDATISITYLRSNESGAPEIEFIDTLPAAHIKEIDIGTKTIVVTPVDTVGCKLIIPKEVLSNEDLNILIALNPFGNKDNFH